jgi:hypothetical protein
MIPTATTPELKTATVAVLDAGCLVRAIDLQPDQLVLHEGRLLKVRRVVPALTRPTGCHVHLVAPDWQPKIGVASKLALAHESDALIRVACPRFKEFQVVA